LEQLNDVESASVNLSLGKATLKCSSNTTHLNLHALMEALDNIGLKAYLDLSFVDNDGTTTNNNNAFNNNNSGLGPIEPPKPLKKETPLMLLDQLRLGGDNDDASNQNNNNTLISKRRYRCSCGCMECICSDRPIIAGDEGKDINLAELCSRLEDSLGWCNNNNNNIQHDNNNNTSLMDQVQQQNGGSDELRNSLEQIDFPCGCGNI